MYLSAVAQHAHASKERKEDGETEGEANAKERWRVSFVDQRTLGSVTVRVGRTTTMKTRLCNIDAALSFSALDADSDDAFPVPAMDEDATDDDDDEMR